MNLKYLGDALDHWKGALFGKLQESGLLRRFAVDLMATDLEPWSADDRRLYCSLVHVENHQLVEHRADLAQARHSYFDEIAHDGDLFLDPDTGVATGHVAVPTQYVFPGELRDLFIRAEDRVVTVYQHIRARRPEQRIAEVLAAIRSSGSRFTCTSYHSATVAMLFLAPQRVRIEAIADYFQGLLGAHSEQRIRFWQ